jgi:bla regulator protein BlaR1
MRAHWVWFIFAAFASVITASARAQAVQGESPLPSFDVVSIRLWQPGASSAKVAKVASVGAAPAISDQWHFVGQTELLIESAFNLPVRSGRVLDEPGWMQAGNDRYDITATIPPSQFAAMQQMSPSQRHRQLCLLEQALLADRFGLKAHVETRSLPMYALVAGKGGPGLKPVAATQPSRLRAITLPEGTELTANAISLDELVQSPLFRVHGEGVINQTGLAGSFDLRLQWSSDDEARCLERWRPEGTPACSDQLFPSIFSAVQEQLGLRLVPVKAPREVVVIDHIARPAPN